MPHDDRDVPQRLLGLVSAITVRPDICREIDARIEELRAKVAALMKAKAASERSGKS
jgi:hypothetical protein